MTHPPDPTRHLESPPTIAASVGGTFTERMIGRKVGRYTIRSLIGEGGMGAVYLAEQDHPNRQVALKLIRPGTASHQLLKRFALEAEALGRLQHPGIAQIHEAGAHDSGEGAQPYFAMEYIKGDSLDMYLRHRTLGTRQRMELAAKICDAVQHAHQKGLIHRDLKPGNILVTEDGQPKILDFGVARATDGDIKTTTLQTDIGQLIGTVPYMSPEQVTGDPDNLDTRSDVYALGVMIYEMLTGRLPYELERKMIHEAVRVIREQEPTRLSVVDRVFRGDIETIVGKALEKDKTLRYQAASALAADIRRYLNDEPIAAAPPSRWYRIKKFTRRHKVLVTATTCIFLALLVGSALATWQAIRAIAAEKQATLDRDAARIQAAKAEHTASFIRTMLEGISPATAKGRDTSLLRDILDQTAKRAESELADQPEVEAAIRYTVGSTLSKIGSYDRADAELNRAAQLQLATTGDNTPELLRTRNAQARVLAFRGHHADAETLLRKTFARQTELLTPNHKDTLACAYDLALAVARQGRYQESEAIALAAVNRATTFLSPDDDLTLSTQVVLGSAIHMQSRHDEAEAILRNVLQRRIARDGPADLSVAIVRSNLASILIAQKKLDEAELLHLAALDAVKHLYGSTHPETLKQMNNVAVFYRELARYDDALALHHQTLELRQKVLGHDHAETLFSIYNIGDTLYRMGGQDKLDQAETFIRQSLDARRRTLGPEHADTINSMSALALILNAQRRFTEVAALLGEVARAERQRRGDKDPDLGIAYYNWAATLQNIGDNHAAETAFRETLDLHQASGKTDEPYWAAAYNGLAKCLVVKGLFDEAKPLFEEGLAMRKRLFGDEHRETAYSLNDYADSLVQQGNLIEAEQMLRSALAISEKAKAESPLTWSQSLRALGACLVKQERFAEAEPLLLQALEAVISAEAAGGRVLSADIHRQSLTHLIDLYDKSNATNPSDEHAAALAKWRAELEAFDAAQER